MDRLIQCLSGLALAALTAVGQAQGSGGDLPDRPAGTRQTAQETGRSPERHYWIYAAAESADQVYKIHFDGRQASIVKTIDVGYQATEIEGPHGLTVSPDGKHWFLTMAHGKPNGLLYKYSTATDRVLGRTTLGLFPATMEISRATGLLYCVNFDLHGTMRPSSVSIVDIDSMTEVARTTTGAMPHGSRLSPDGTRHYSCAMMSGELFEIDALTFAVKRKLQLAETPKPLPIPPGATSRPTAKVVPPKPTWVQPHPTAPQAFVCLNGIQQIAWIDTKNWRIVRRLPTAKGPYNLAVAPDGRTLVVTYKGAQSIGIWDLPKGVERARLPTTRRISHGVVISPDSRFAFVTSEGIGSEPGSVDVFDLRAGKRVSSVAIGLQAGGITFWKMTSTR